jgi:hypothetical protein
MVEDENGLTSELPWCSIFFDSHFAFSFSRIRGVLVALGGGELLGHWPTPQPFRLATNAVNFNNSTSSSHTGFRHTRQHCHG